MKKINILYTTIMLLLVVTTYSSCKKDQVIGGTEVQDMSGEWWVNTTYDGGESGFYKISTFNTAANSASEMWIDDDNTFYGLKAKVKTNVSSHTFTADEADELYYEVKVTITDGKVIKNAATAPGTGIKTDSIYFNATFTGDPTVYNYAGYKRTRFHEDDH